MSLLPSSTILKLLNKRRVEGFENSSTLQILLANKKKQHARNFDINKISNWYTNKERQRQYQDSEEEIKNLEKRIQNLNPVKKSLNLQNMINQSKRHSNEYLNKYSTAGADNMQYLTDSMQNANKRVQTKTKELQNHMKQMTQNQKKRFLNQRLQLNAARRQKNKTSIGFRERNTAANKEIERAKKQQAQFEANGMRPQK